MANENALLAALPADDRRRLIAQCDNVALPKGKILYESGDAMPYAYFPTHGLISLLATTADGDAVEAALVGPEGFIGFSIVLGCTTCPHQIVAQLRSAALRIRADLLRAHLSTAKGLGRAILRHTYRVATDISRSLLCHRFHSTAQRLSRWLLIAQERAGTDTLKLTHEGLARILGVPRSVVTEAAVELQDAGLIAYRHGTVVIKSQEGLRLTTCDCYCLGYQSVAPSDATRVQPATAQGGDVARSVGFRQCRKPTDSERRRVLR